MSFHEREARLNMTITMQGNGWHVETFDVTRGSIDNQVARVSPHTLDRPGVFVGGSATMDHDLAVGATAGISVAIRATDDTQLAIGEDITAFETVIFNDSGLTAIVGAKVMVFIRDHRN